ncbi:hypothetical protein [Aeromonas phage AS-yj]|uniref:Uncharacterized protein n=7 Tax=Caudoviricetes TaxID=2731619 RepID=A0A291LDB8_9CAUD|nr:tail fiber chaperone [Aeromonas phage CC2]YP_009834647.1 tail fiber chaperone [Aeromonas phage AS-zj]YP_009834880.1 tail fiber chaperone [Aeromonas phage AS-sw]ATI17388.1 hypothetical protein [Aeromonas phage AS-szw]ATI17705.1 hypothetical protein [Aeromonas phage AS-yj]QAX97830.1 hypothetical protein ASswx1_186 [Aeromonas phage Asswx_1]QAX99117.1 hypothetical protein assk_332 [Aeromonas phage Assk]QMV29114.1 hypothetical protein AP1_0411 [Aeromonas phage AP1]UKM62869.1 hypothetical prot
MQEQIQKLSSDIIVLKARIFDMSEESVAISQQNAKIFSMLAEALELDKEESSDIQFYLNKINHLKQNQVEVVKE